MKYLFLDLFSIEKLWEVLGWNLIQLFGKDCATSMIWMIIGLLLRYLANLLGFSHLSYYYFFGCPVVLKVLNKYFPIMEKNSPILPFRLVESILGRLTPVQILVIIPAHFLGCILGVAIFYCLFPLNRDLALSPIIYNESTATFRLISEALLVFVYCVELVAIPEMLSVNKLPSSLIHFGLLPLLYISPLKKGTVYDPSILYSLWYMQNLFCDKSDHLSLQIEHFVGPTIGAIAAGLLCSRFFPDDPLHWKRK